MTDKEIIYNRYQKLLLHKDFELTVEHLQKIHAYLFAGFIPNSGQFRTYNITKKEEILYGNSVIYADYHNINAYLKYDITYEKQIDYHNISYELLIKRISDFLLRIWQAHPFEDGNTRTTITFVLKFLNTIGYDIDSEYLRMNIRQLRNSLVIRLYTEKNTPNNISYLPLEDFLRMLVKEKSQQNKIKKTLKIR